MPTTQDIVQKLWNLCHVLRDDGITYHQYVAELTYLLFLKMAKETGTESQIPEGYRWADLERKDGVELKSGAGQYFTPRPLIESVVSLVRPQPRELVQDPAAGTGGFLIVADR